MNDKKQLRLIVEGIVCAGCAMDMETVFRNTDGINAVAVDYGRSEIRIEYLPEEITEDHILAQVRRMGISVIKKA